MGSLSLLFSARTFLAVFPAIVLALSGAYIAPLSFLWTLVTLRAIAKIEVGWRSEEMEIAVQDDLMFDALIGADYPDIWELGKQLVHKELVNLAQTPNARKVDYKEVNSDVSDTSEDDMKEARNREDQEPEVCCGDNEIKKGEDDHGPPAAKHSESQK